MRYWLVKADPSDISVDDLRNRPNGIIAWYGIRNYQSRNFMRDQMSVGDQILFYHSSCKQPGIIRSEGKFCALKRKLSTGTITSPPPIPNNPAKKPTTAPKHR